MKSERSIQLCILWQAGSWKLIFAVLTLKVYWKKEACLDFIHHLLWIHNLDLKSLFNLCVQDGRVRTQDQLVAINDHSLTGMTLKDAQAVVTRISLR